MSVRKIFGDFQTPPDLARQVCEVVRKLGFEPDVIVEPTCGVGAFVNAAANAFPSVTHVLAADINPDYVHATRERLRDGSTKALADIFVSDVFTFNWGEQVSALEGAVLVVGNPPWVTISELGALAGANAPSRRTDPGVRGLAAMTGKSNFDVAEWILREACDWGQGRPRLIAMLCKSSVARKVLKRLWLDGRQTSLCEMRTIDAKAHFDVAVSACLLTIGLDIPGGGQRASVFASLDAQEPIGELALFQGEKLVSDLGAAHRLKEIYNPSGGRMWRSGVKHDCAAVMELDRVGDQWVTSAGECLDVEPDRIFPLFKSSDLAKGADAPRRWVIVTQSSVGEDTTPLRLFCPKLWAYLERNRAAFDRRGSSIYRGKPPFSMFGVGDYSFSPWKVAVSGLYKRPRFVVLGPEGDKPPMVDDTAYFLPFSTREDAQEAADYLNAPDALDFLRAHSFSDDKRPLTTELLRSIDMAALIRRAHDDRPESQATDQTLVRSGGATQHWSDILTDAEVIKMRA